VNRGTFDKWHLGRAYKALAFAGIFAMSSLLFVAPAAAQEVVTLALVNGERPSGQLVDMNAKGFVLRVNGQDRTYPANDVAAVEFVVGGPTAAATTALNSGQSVIVMRDGTMIQGRLTDIGGTSPLRLTVDTPSGSRDLRSNEVAQVHLRKTSQANVAATAGNTAGGGSAIVVAANRAWTDTGMTVARLDVLNFAGSGDIMVSPSASAGVAGAEIKAATPRRLPVPNAPVGALIARIGDGNPFLVGTRGSMPMPSAGKLYLGVNDEYYDDNSGSFNVTITKK
jgi:hypothetical protein